MIAGAFHDDVEQIADPVAFDLGPVAERRDVTSDRCGIQCSVRPQTDEAVECPRNVPPATARCGEIPVDEHPAVWPGDEIPRRQVVVGNHLGRAGGVAAFFAPHSIGGRSEPRLGAVEVGNEAPGATQSMLLSDQVKSVRMNTTARDKREDLPAVIVETERSRRRI